jgi:L-2,4-diaminobutyrate decarboxylase
MDPFSVDLDGLRTATEMLASMRSRPATELPATPPTAGLGPIEALEVMAPILLDNARDLGAPGFFAHMDPPTPWVTWAVSQWTASRNQNLLHPDVAPTARRLEELVVGWFAPLFGMDGGHMTPGSTIANLTALWAAREAGCRRVVATSNAHLSIRKAAHVLAMEYVEVEWEDPGDLNSAVAVVTAGATSTGAIESLDASAGARWRHVDAAWAGPLRLSETHRHLLDGIEAADSVAVSAHKWLFQPKESAFVFFADTDPAHRSISLDGAYLTVPNIGILGSHGATAAPLATTVMAYGLDGIASWIDKTMGLADRLHQLVVAHPSLEARTAPQSGVVNWRRIDRTIPVTDDVLVSTTVIDGETWLRSVAANPMADPDLIVETVGR